MSLFVLPDTVRRGLLAWAESVMASRPPDFVIGPAGDPYLQRWHLVRSQAHASVYVHRILRSDDDRALHDHRSDNVSIILKGGYLEIVPRTWAIPLVPADTQQTRAIFHGQGEVFDRAAEAAHRLEVEPGAEVITLFITGPTAREWGFWCPQGWRRWQDFVAADDAGSIGPGCGGAS